jgi:hypothetical protein
MKFSEKQIKTFAIIFFLLLYIFFIVYKITKYNLFCYIHDLFSVISTSCGWMHGHPVWWDNRYGFTPAIHFSFTAPLLSPFIILFGGKGLFIFHALICFLAFYFTIRNVTDKNILHIRLAALAVFLLSPYAFWLFDDTTYGWHIELVLLQLAVFFALALLSKKRWLVVLCALLLVFTKEDGIVIACCVHLLYALRGSADQKTNWKKIFLISGAWVIVFLCALFVIKFFRNFEETRLEAALREFHEDTRFYNAGYFRKITWQFMVMLFPVTAFCFYILRRTDFLKLILLTTPLIVTGIIAGLWYSGDIKLSVSWAPRFSEIMGVMLAGTIILLTHRKNLKLQFRKPALSIAVIAALTLQVFTLMAAHDYNLFSEIKKAATHSFPQNINSDDEQVIKSIAEKTPQDFNVAVPYQYFSAFDKNDLTWFGYYDYAPKRNPDLIILEDSSKFSEYKFDYEEYQIQKEGKFFVLIKKDKTPLNFSCN